MPDWTIDLNNLIAGIGNDSSLYGQSYIGQMSSAADALREMRQMIPKDDPRRKSPEFLAARRTARNTMAQSAIGGVSAIAGGITGMAAPGMQNMQLGDVTQYENAIRSLGDLSTGTFNDVSSLADAYNNLNSNYSADIDYNTVRGGSTGQRVGNVLSSTMSGVGAGASVGGWWGALAGGVLGLGSGLGTLLSGNSSARIKQQQLAYDTRMARKKAAINLGAAADRINDNTFRSGYANAAAEGGEIERDEPTMEDFVKAIHERQKMNSITRSSGIVRRHCKGGTMIRIKM